MGTNNWNMIKTMGGGEDSKPEDWLPKQHATKSRLRMPNEILRDLNSERQQFVDKVVAAISIRLEKEFTGEPVLMWIDEPKMKIERDFKKLSSIFSNRHWRIEIKAHNASQKDGDSTQLLISPTE